MTNNLEFRKEYLTTLDLVYKKASQTAILDGANDLARPGANANELLVPRISTSGLSDYDRNNGFSTGTITMDYQTIKCDYDRGKKFNIDVVDNMDTANLAYANAAAEFTRVQAVPELDAWRISKYATKATENVTETFSDTDAILKSLSNAKVMIQDCEADLGTCVLFITAKIKEAIKNLDSYKSAAAIEDFAQVEVVPKGRFYKTVTLGDDGWTGESPLNYLIVDKNAARQYVKHLTSSVISPEMNQSADAYLYKYRTVGCADVLEKKLPGIYVSVAGE